MVLPITFDPETLYSTDRILTPQREKEHDIVIWNTKAVFAMKATQHVKKI